MSSTLVPSYLYLAPSSPRYLPQHPTLKHPQTIFLPLWQTPSFKPIWNKEQYCIWTYFKFIFFIPNWTTTDSVGNCSTHSLFDFLLKLFWFVRFVPKYLKVSKFTRTINFLRIYIFKLFILLNVSTRNST
jgi:hypothetical protein